MDFKNNLIKPLLFMVFNRPEKTAIVWNEIKKAKPKKLYISSDAPRNSHPSDIEKVKKVRDIITNIDWDCDVKYLFHEQNQGCSFAGKAAFDWVFSQESEMIELEDDTVPSASFFWFMQEMLEQYKDHPKVGYITGQNFMGIQSGDASYFFSHYGGSSGWATWKRVYNQWEFRLDEFYNTAYTAEFRSHFDSYFEYKFWLRNFESFVKKPGNTYDLQSAFLSFKNDYFNIIPNLNLITNIGFDHEGTNFNGGIEKFANKKKYEFTEILHLNQLIRHSSVDKKIFQFHFLNRSKISYCIRWMIGHYYRWLKDKIKTVS